MDGMTAMQLIGAISDVGGLGILAGVLFWFVRTTRDEVEAERTRNNKLTNGLMESYRANADANAKMAGALDSLSDTTKEMCSNFQDHRRKTEK